MDYYDCKSRSASVRNIADAIMTESYCMQSKGYTWY
jgi:hypothetical protein